MEKERFVNIKRTKLNDRNMTAVWTMHQEGKSMKQICNALDLSGHSVGRIVKAMELTKRGDLKAIYADKSIGENIIDFAKNYFGVGNEEEKQPEPMLNPHDNTALILTKIVYALERNNYLLERIAAELGVKNTDDVKG